MATVIMSLFLSTLEVICIFLLAFRIFRFPIEEYSVIPVMVGMLLALFSHSIRNWFGLAAYDLFIQLLLIVFVIKFISGISWFYSFLLTFAGAFSYTIIQMVVMGSLNLFGIYTLSDAITGLNVPALLMQTCSIILAFAACWFMHKLNFGFSFIPYYPQAIRIKGLNSTILLTVFLTVASLIITVLATMKSIYWLFYIVTFINVLLFIYLMYISHKKEYENV